MMTCKLAIATLITMINTLCGNGNLYATTFAVVEVADDYVLCVDFDGEEWAFDNDDKEDWERGDLVSCIMYDNGTDEIYDDEILTARYSGWCDYFGWDSEYEMPIVIFDDLD